MKVDSRLSSVLHVLLHVAASPRPLTSEALAASLGTNPVVVRRTLSDLRKARYVRSAKGHGGGWTVEVDLSRVTLFDVYRALGSPSVFAIGHRRKSSPCVVEQAVNAALDGVLSEAEQLVVQRFKSVSVADLVGHFSRRLAERAKNECPNAR